MEAGRRVHKMEGFGREKPSIEGARNS